MGHEAETRADALGTVAETSGEPLGTVETVAKATFAGVT